MEYLRKFNADLEVSESPSVDELANALRLNEKRRAGLRAVGTITKIQLEQPEVEIPTNGGGPNLVLTWSLPELVPFNIEVTLTTYPALLDPSEFSQLLPPDTTEVSIGFGLTGSYVGYVLNKGGRLEDTLYLDSSQGAFSLNIP